MENYISLYRDLKISKAELQQAVGDDLYNVRVRKPYMIRCSDIVNAINSIKNKSISENALIDWVNVVWFTELFAFKDEEADSIVSVLAALECMDEVDVEICDSDLDEMIRALNSNNEYDPS